MKTNNLEEINKTIRDIKKSIDKSFVNWHYIKLSPDDVKSNIKVEVDIKKIFKQEV